jgi:epoxide hydrolase-like predicted phosphatase
VRAAAYDARVQADTDEAPTGVLRGLIMDWGGVLTAPVDEAIAHWAQQEHIDLELFRTAMRSLVEMPASPLLELERGRLGPDEFERLLAKRLREHGVAINTDGLLARMLEGLRDVSGDMVSLVRRARRHGLRTALLSNSWGEHYPEHLWVGAFDAVVISGRVGMRKPDPEIFLHTAQLLGLSPQECVLVDDFPANIDGAVATGMAGVLHRDYDGTVAELEILFGVPLH